MMLILLRLLPLITLYILFFFVEFKIVMLGYLAACIVQLLLYKIFLGRFSIPHALYFLSGLIFVGGAFYFKNDVVFMYEISFLLILSAIYILYTYFTAEKGSVYIMGISQPTDQKILSLTYLNYVMSAMYLVLGLGNLAIVYYFPPIYWLNFRVFGVYLCLMLVSGIIGLSLARSDEHALKESKEV